MSNPGVMGLGPRFRDLLDAGPVAGLDDAQLLARFLGGRGPASELAFAAIVARHGPMVHGVCRRASLDPHDAADAFQATFLVLVRRARSVRVDDSLGRWLYGVSRRVARRARVRTGRRRMFETGPEPLDHLVGPDHDPGLPIHRREQRATLDEEIARLPAAFRAAVVLCDLEGRSIEAAAHALECPVGTVKSRLARGRARLRDRLERRGIAPAVPVALAESTTRAAVLLKLTPSLAAGMIPAATLALTQEVVTAMSMIPMKWLGTAVLISALTTGVVAGKPGQPDGMPTTGAPAASSAANNEVETALNKLRGLIEATQEEPTRERVKPLQQAQAELEAAIARNRTGTTVSTLSSGARSSMSEHVVHPRDILFVELTEPGRISPIRGEMAVRPDGRINLGKYGEVHVAGRTRAEIKLVMIEHLRTHFTEEELGLSVSDPNTRITKVSPPAESEALKVEVIRRDGPFYHVLGDVASPGHRVFTGQETVLDAIQQAAGLSTAGKPAMITLVRSDPARPDGPGKTYPVDYPAMIERGDTTTNYQLMPDDCLIVSRVSESMTKAPVTQPSPDVETRLQAVEKKLDALIERLDRLPRP